MLFTSSFFNNYEEFKTRFPKIISGGATRYADGLLLSIIKDILRYPEWRDLLYGTIDSVEQLEFLFLNKVTKDINRGNDYIRFEKVSSWFSPFYYYSEEFVLDNDGICHDLDARCVRYIRKDNHKEFKKKAGAFFRSLIIDSAKYNGYSSVPEKILIHICERFSDEWQAERLKDAKMELHYGDTVEDFKNIYNTDSYMGSCMNGKPFYKFYANHCNCTAAWLEREGEIVARCVIFNEVFQVHNKEAKPFRLAERQYAKDGNNILKSILIRKLIDTDLIDGYKKVGAGCHDPFDFILNSGADFNISTYIKLDDTIENINNNHRYFPYMDSFKYGNYYDNILYNNESMCDYYSKAVFENTDGNIECNEEEEEDQGIWSEYDGEYYDEEDVIWSEYHESYILHERSITLANGDVYHDDDLEDGTIMYVECEDDYYLADDCTYDEYTEENILKENAVTALYNGKEITISRQTADDSFEYDEEKEVYFLND